MQVTPLTPRLGAEIEGLDLKRLEQAEFDALRQAWLRYKVVFLRDQSLDLEQLQQFGRRFGELMRLPYIKPQEDHPYVIRVLKQADEIDMGVFGGDWHSDFSFLEAPPAASILYAEQVPGVGGDTLWIDMAAAYAALPQERKALLRGRDAIHSGTAYGVAHAPEESTQFKGSIEIERNNPEADRETRHPAVCRHPETGEPMLFINPTYTIRIDGLAEGRSRELLGSLYAHCNRPEFGCRFKWRARSIALWDNRSTLHYAVNDYDGHRRCLYRVTVAGHPPRAAW
jgi:taurine dioxygenase